MSDLKFPFYTPGVHGNFLSSVLPKWTLVVQSMYESVSLGFSPAFAHYFHVPWSCVQESCESTTFICKIDLISAVMWHRMLPVLQKRSEVTGFLVLLLFLFFCCAMW